MTLLLAAATAALPFTPPTGWVQLPQSAMNVVASVWSGPKDAHGKSSDFIATAMAFPGTLEMFAPRPKKSTHHRLSTTLSNVSVRLCGVPARSITSRVNAAGASTILTQVVAVKNGYAYMLMYSRAASAPADAQISHLMKTFCPNGTASITSLAPPSGWTKTGNDMRTVGMWMGTKPGEVMMLMRGTPLKSLDTLFRSTLTKTPNTRSQKSPIHIDVQNRTSMCGYPGMLADISLPQSPLPVSEHVAVTQGNGVAYFLSYMQMGTVQADPAAMSALHSLCVTGASPAPSVPPSPSASPSASASPSPTATP